jgi:hypothetical protein
MSQLALNRVCAILLALMLASTLHAQVSKGKKKPDEKLATQLFELDPGYNSNLKELLSTLPIDFSKIADNEEDFFDFYLHISENGNIDSLSFVRPKKFPQSSPRFDSILVKHLERFKSSPPLRKGRPVRFKQYIEYFLTSNATLRNFYINSEDSSGRIVYGPFSFISADSQPVPLNLAALIKSIPFPDIIIEKGTTAPVLVFRVLVSPEGEPKQFVLIGSPPEELAYFVKPFLKTLRFSPATRSNKAIYYWVTIPIKYPFRRE